MKSILPRKKAVPVIIRNITRPLLIICATLATGCLSAKNVDLSTFGASGDGKTDNTAAFRAAFQYAKDHPGTTLDIPHGTYRLTTPTAQFGNDNYILHLKELSDTTVDGHGSELIIGAPAGAFYLENCFSLTFKNIAFDYDPLPMTQGNVLELIPSENAIIVDVDPGYPRHDDPDSFAREEDRIQSWITLHQPDSTPLLGPRVLRVIRYEALNDGTFKLYHDTPQLEKIPGVSNGVRYVRVFRRWGHLIRAYACNDLTYTNLSFYSASGFVSLISYCNRTTVENCRILPRPDSTRMLSTSADGFHFIGGTRATLKDNRFSELQDDNIVLATRGNLIDKISGNILTLAPASETLYRKNDIIDVLNINSGQREQYTAQGVEKSGTYPLSRYTLALDRPLTSDLAANQTPYPLMAFNRSQALPGSRIIGNTMTHCRARGILLHAIDVQVENNTISHFTGAGIAGGLLVQFPKSLSLGKKGFWAYYLAEDIEIKNNTFDSCLNYGGNFGYRGAITFESLIQGNPSAIANAPSSNLSINSNRISRSGRGGIAVENARYAEITNNTITAMNRFQMTPAYGICLENVDDYKLEGNTIEGPATEKIHITSPGQPRAAIQ